MDISLLFVVRFHLGLVFLVILHGMGRCRQRSMGLEVRVVLLHFGGVESRLIPFLPTKIPCGALTGCAYGYGIASILII